MCNTITNENILHEVIHYEGIVKGDFFYGCNFYEVPCTILPTSDILKD